MTNATAVPLKLEVATCHPAAVLPNAFAPVLSIGKLWLIAFDIPPNTKPPPPTTVVPVKQNARAKPVPASPCWETYCTFVAPGAPVAPGGPGGPAGPGGPTMPQLISV
jgi:hypothetical protein